MSIHSLIILALLAIAPGVVFAKGNSSIIPKNAHAKSYGGGWECDRGHREVKGACAAVKLPINTYQPVRSYGRGWECLWGFAEVNGICFAVKVPSNGYFVDESYGSGWSCKRGYRAVDNTCVAIKLPKNAHIGYSGNSWDCNPPYLKGRHGCASP